MKVTNHGLKGRQLQKEDYWQKAAAEQQGYAGGLTQTRMHKGWGHEATTLFEHVLRKSCGY